MTPLLRFDITWTDPPGEHHEAGLALAWGAGVLYVGEAPVWFVGNADAPQPVAWSWIELLEFLGSRWLHMTTEQSYPRDLVMGDPRELRFRAMQAYGAPHFDNELSDDLDVEIFRFEGRHDLARALRGISLASVFLLREGDTVRVATDRGVQVADRRAVFAELEKIGDAIATRLAGSRSDRAKAAMSAWRRRAETNPSQVVRIALGRAELGSVTLDFLELVNEPGADSELAAAARFMAGASPSVNDFNTILTAIKATPPASCAKLDELTKAFARVLDDTRNKDQFDQGYALARELRRALPVVDGKEVDVDKMVRDFGVAIIDTMLSPAIDAVGCWGRLHGPAIILNKSGRRAKTTHGRKFTIAHELCHLLADRATALPLAEVMGGGSPYPPERRANAFGAELLLPQWEAKAIYAKKRGEPRALEKALGLMKMRFKVGQILAAAQLKNAPHNGVTPSEQAQLESMVQGTYMA